MSAHRLLLGGRWAFLPENRGRGGENYEKLLKSEDILLISKKMVDDCLLLC